MPAKRTHRSARSYVSCSQALLQSKCQMHVAPTISPLSLMKFENAIGVLCFYATLWCFRRKKNCCLSLPRKSLLKASADCSHYVSSKSGEIRKCEGVLIVFADTLLCYMKYFCESIQSGAQQYRMLISTSPKQVHLLHWPCLYKVGKIRKIERSALFAAILCCVSKTTLRKRSYEHMSHPDKDLAKHVPDAYTCRAGNDFKKVRLNSKVLCFQCHATVSR